MLWAPVPLLFYSLDILGFKSWLSPVDHEGMDTSVCVLAASVEGFVQFPPPSICQNHKELETWKVRHLTELSLTSYFAFENVPAINLRRVSAFAVEQNLPAADVLATPTMKRIMKAFSHTMDIVIVNVRQEVQWAHDYPLFPPPKPEGGRVIRCWLCPDESFTMKDSTGFNNHWTKQFRVLSTAYSWRLLIFCVAASHEGRQIRCALCPSPKTFFFAGLVGHHRAKYV
ncbi:hypothetical protein FB451DRAFT_1176048 [Mycena latifolia]|nr:hypothetical protein FB451DRAFT_1176048 [Mycena latifolia]